MGSGRMLRGVTGDADMAASGVAAVGSGLMLVGVKIDVEVLLVPWTLVIVLTVAASDYLVG